MTEHSDLTVKEVAALFHLNVGTVKKLCRDGDLPGAYKITAYRTARQTES